MPPIGVLLLLVSPPRRCGAGAAARENGGGVGRGGRPRPGIAIHSAPGTARKLGNSLFLGFEAGQTEQLRVPGPGGSGGRLPGQPQVRSGRRECAPGGGERGLELTSPVPAPRPPKVRE